LYHDADIIHLLCVVLGWLFCFRILPQVVLVAQLCVAVHVCPHAVSPNLFVGRLSKRCRKWIRCHSFCFPQFQLLSLVGVESAPDAERNLVVDGELGASLFDGTRFAYFDGNFGVLVVSEGGEEDASVHPFAGCLFFPVLFSVVECPFG
jgi:hypothetical protein